MQVIRYFILCFFIILSACGSPPVKEKPIIDLTVNQIQTLTNFSELNIVLTRLKVGLQGKDSQKYAQDYGMMALIEDQMVAVKKASVSSNLSEIRLDSGVIPIPILDEKKKQLMSFTNVSAEKWTSVTDLIDVEIERSNKQIAVLSEMLQQQSMDDEQELSLLDELLALSGDDSWLSKRDDFIETLLSDIRDAKERDVFDEKVQAKVSLVRRERGDDANLVNEMTDVDTYIYEKLFFEALSNADPDAAYDVFVTMSESKYFPDIKERLADTSQRMASLFTAMADESVRNPENMSQSYRWYSQSRKIYSKLEVSRQTSTGEQLLIEQLKNQLNAISETQSRGVSLAYLYLIEEFSPGTEKLRQNIKQAERAVRQLSRKKVSTTRFDTSSTKHDYGDVMSSSITQYLFNRIPNDVRIIERDQYEAIMREKSLSGTSGTELKAVDLIITGSVLEAKVESTEAKGKKILRVVVGKERMPNPGYITWLEMPSKERDKVDKPTDTIELDKYENITIVITRHRKVGVFSVSYRLVDADSGKIIFPDSITVNQEFEDNSSEGVEMGDFILPFKLADLPSDVEILDRLASDVTKQIGSKLVGKLENQEQQYITLADNSTDSSDCFDEINLLAKALQLMSLKDLDVADVKARYMQRALACYSVP